MIISIFYNHFFQRRFTEVFCEMLRHVVGKTGTHLGIPLMMYQSSSTYKLKCQNEAKSEANRNNDEEEESEDALNAPLRGQRISEDSFYSNTARWRTRREGKTDKIDYCL